MFARTLIHYAGVQARRQLLHFPSQLHFLYLSPHRLTKMVHIKRVLIQGFKSYKDQTEFDDFHEGLNCIGRYSRAICWNNSFVWLNNDLFCSSHVVGKNGSGKSNFFFGTYLRIRDRPSLCWFFSSRIFSNPIRSLWYVYQLAFRWSATASSCK